MWEKMSENRRGEGLTHPVHTHTNTDAAKPWSMCAAVPKHY